MAFICGEAHVRNEEDISEGLTRDSPYRRGAKSRRKISEPLAGLKIEHLWNQFSATMIPVIHSRLDHGT